MWFGNPPEGSNARAETPSKGQGVDDLVAGLIVTAPRCPAPVQERGRSGALFGARRQVPGDMVVSLGAGTISTWPTPCPTRWPAAKEGSPCKMEPDPCNMGAGYDLDLGPLHPVGLFARPRWATLPRMRSSIYSRIFTADRRTCAIRLDRSFREGLAVTLLALAALCHVFPQSLALFLLAKLRGPKPRGTQMSTSPKKTWFLACFLGPSLRNVLAMTPSSTALGAAPMV